jgi:hypothetical protein
VLDDVEMAGHEATVGQLKWVARCRPDAGHFIHAAGTGVPAEKTVEQAMAANKVVRYLKNEPDVGMFLPVLNEDDPMRVVTLPDASLGNLPSGKTAGGFLLGLADGEPGDEVFNMAVVKSRAHTVKRVAVSTFDAECLELIEAVDDGMVLKLLVEESVNGPALDLKTIVEMRARGTRPPDRTTVPLDAYCDGLSVVQNVNKLASTTMNKRRVLDIAHLREAIELKYLRSLLHVDGRVNPANPLTKRCSPQEISRIRMMRLLQHGVCDLTADGKPVIQNS